MNVRLVESLAQAARSLTPEERSLLEEKLKAMSAETPEEGKERPFYETATSQEWVKAFREWAETDRGNTTATPQERAKAFREWAETDRGNMPYLSDEAISRETIYGDRG